MTTDTDDAPFSAICDVGGHDECMVWGCVCHCHDDHVADVLEFPRLAVSTPKDATE